MLKNLLKITVLLVMVYAVGRFIVVFQDSRLTGERAPYIQMLTPTSVIVRWLTEEAQLGVVRYGDNPEHLTKIELDEDTTTNHIVKLPNLKPGTQYYYQVGDTGGFNRFEPKKYWFKTYPTDVVATRVWVIGDSGEAGEALTRVRDEAFRWMKNNPLAEVVLEEEMDVQAVDLGPSSLMNIWLGLGDIAYSSGTNDQYQAALFDPFENLLAHVALLPVYGNHDDRRWTYFRIFETTHGLI